MPIRSLRGRLPENLQHLIAVGVCSKVEITDPFRHRAGLTPRSRKNIAKEMSFRKTMRFNGDLPSPNSPIAPLQSWIQRTHGFLAGLHSE